jgi:signal transduction histidine kinase
LLLGWLPVWLLFTALIVGQHSLGVGRSSVLALKAVVPAALLSLLVHRLAQRLPWPRPFRVRFLAIHVFGALVYSFAWLGATSLLESALAGRLIMAPGPGLTPFVALGVWLYVIVAGVSYTHDATARAARAEAEAARAEAEAARAQLQALRAQLHPHFLFNALHTVVQLIPEDPARASSAAMRVAELLRATIEEERDLVSVRSEWAFVESYLALEHIRFGERLRVTARVPESVIHCMVPAFALQTLVENAVRHGAAPREERTALAIDIASEGETLVVRVTDDGVGATPEQLSDGSGSGIRRLRARLRALYGEAASLTVTGTEGKGVQATLVVPASEAAE